jgi:ATP-dependent DNA ligase
MRQAPPETVIDGEVVAIDDNGRASFNRLQHHRSNRHLQFFAFDLPDYGGRKTARALLEEALES